jgi:plasmid rolling circle replication initiator protein Rep
LKALVIAMIEAITPFLDNIETSCTSSDFSKAFDINGSELSGLKNLYSFDEEKIIESFDFYKRLSVETSTCLLDFGSDLYKPLSLRLRGCGSELGLTSEGKVASANFCRERLCPMCQRRRSLRTYSDFCKILSDLNDFSFLHLVLTVPNCEASELRQTLRHMELCSARLFKVDKVERAFRGVARCTEVTYNKRLDNYHPHFHCLVAVKKSYFTSRDYLNHKTLCELWSVLWKLRLSNLRRLKDEEIFFQVSNLLDSEKLQLHVTKADKGALPEIAKYAVKPLELDLNGTERAKVLQELYEALKGKRLIQTFGVIKDSAKKCKLDLNDSVGLDTLDKTPKALYTFNYGALHYERKELI